MRAVDELNQTYHQLWRKSGWTRARIARELGVNYTSVYRWESGETTPEPSKLMLLAQLIGEPVQIAGVRTVPTPPLGRIDETEMQFLSELRKIPQPTRAEILGNLTKLVRLSASLGPPRDATRETSATVEKRLSDDEAAFVMRMRAQAEQANSPAGGTDGSTPRVRAAKAQKESSGS